MNKSNKEKQNTIIQFLKDSIVALSIVLLINNFIALHARVPSGSMLPTIEIGDHLIVNRLPYYFTDPTRGEIIVFNFKEDDTGETVKYIKRVIGLPGETVDIIDGHVYINNELLDESAYLPSETITLESSLVEFPLTIPEGEYLVMGDNRENSHDGRFFGTISRKDIIGTGNIRIFPFNKIGILK